MRKFQDCHRRVSYLVPDEVVQYSTRAVRAAVPVEADLTGTDSHNFFNVYFEQSVVDYGRPLC